MMEDAVSGASIVDIKHLEPPVPSESTHVVMSPPQVPVPRRNTAFFQPPPDIYLNRTVVSTPSGELSLEDLFHEVDSNVDGKISAMHELPVALTIMGLYWDEELGFALLADRAGVDTLEKILSHKCQEWWNHGSTRNSPQISPQVSHHEDAGMLRDRRSTAESVDVHGSSKADGETRKSLVSFSLPTQAAADRAEAKHPPPPPPRPLKSIKPGMQLPNPPLSPIFELRRTSLSGPVEDRSIDWTTFCTIVALLQAAGAYKVMVRQALKRKSEGYTVPGPPEVSPTKGKRQRYPSGRKSDEPRRSSLNEARRPSSYVGVAADAADATPTPSPEIPPVASRNRSRSDADMLPKSARARSIPPIWVSDGVSEPGSATGRSSQAASSIFASPREEPVIGSQTLSAYQGVAGAQILSSPKGTNFSPQEKEAFRRMTQLLKARSAIGPHMPYAISQPPSPSPLANASVVSSGSRSPRNVRSSFTEVVEAVMAAQHLSKKFTKGLGASPSSKVHSTSDEPITITRTGAVPPGLPRSTLMHPPSPSNAAAAMFRNQTIRRHTRSPANLVRLRTGSSPVSHSSNGSVNNLSPHPLPTPTSTGKALTPTTASMVNTADTSTGTTLLKRPSKFNFDICTPRNENGIFETEIITTNNSSAPPNDTTTTTPAAPPSTGHRLSKYEQNQQSLTNMSAITECVAEKEEAEADNDASTHASDTSDSAEPLHEVFLGGACNPTTWRKTTAIPFLEENSITFYNPQVDEWHPGLVLEEAKAKDEAEVVFFVVGPETRAVASMIEVAELISSNRPVVLVLQDVPKDSVMNGHTLHADEIKDLNRGRAYLANVADRHGVTVYQSIEAALREVVSLVQQRRIERVAEARAAALAAEADANESNTDGDDDDAVDAVHFESGLSPDASIEGFANTNGNDNSVNVTSVKREGVGRRASRKLFPRMSTITAISTVTSLDVDDREDSFDDAALQLIAETAHEDTDCC